MQTSPFYLKKFPLFDRRYGMTLYQQRKKIIRGSYNVGVVLVALKWVVIKLPRVFI